MFAEPGPEVARAGWRVLAWLAGALCLVGVVVLALFGLMVWAFVNGGAPTREATRAARSAEFKDPVVAAAARQACARLAADVAAIPEPRPGAAAARRASAMTAENTAIDRLVRRMRALGTARLESDPPAVEWVRDWEELAQARDFYAGDLAAGRPAAFRMPRTRYGFPVVERMDDPAPGCAVPERLYDLPATDHAGQPVESPGYVPRS